MNQQTTLQQLAAAVAAYYIAQARMAFYNGEGGYPHDDDLAEYIDDVVQGELPDLVAEAVRTQLAADTAARG